MKKGLFEQKILDLRRCQLWGRTEGQSFLRRGVTASTNSLGCDGLVILKNVKNEVEVRRGVFSDRALKINFENLDFSLIPMGNL